MAKGQMVRQTRIWSILQTFGKSVFLTLTTADIVGLDEIRKRWRKFRHDYMQTFKASGKPRPRYIMCYEPHPHGHGWHIHIVIECGFLPVDEIRRYSTRAGFGRIHIEPVRQNDRMSDYLGKYVCKVERSVRQAGCKRVRLLNVSRGLTRLSDIEVKSPVVSACREMMYTPAAITDGRKMPCIQRWQLAEGYILFGRRLLGVDIPEWNDIRRRCLEKVCRLML